VPANSPHAGGRRKLVYGGIALGLLAITILARGVVAMPLSGLKDTAGRWTVQEQSDRLELNEQSQGDVELTGAAVRLVLTGSRGLAVCALWISATESQKRGEWNKMDQQIGSITKLQPHFTVPWLFQGWNLSYNVSVMMDRLSDMYFYIARGLNLLAEGESINRNNPDLRYSIAFTYQNKFTVSDKVTTLRCLFQLSCMPKEERDYRKLLRGGRVDLEALRAFTERNPLLVRRLRESLIRYGKDASGNELVMVLAENPRDVVDFLRDNEVLPTRYREDDPRVLEDRLKQFPALPPPFYRDENEELNPNRPAGDAEANALRAARVWFRYANEVIPPPDPVPGPTPMNYRDPERKRRVPKQPMLIIFRQGPPRAQSYIAETLAREGWFDRDPWVVDDPSVSGQNRWFREKVEVKPTDNSQEEWEVAHAMWSAHGQENGLNFSEAERFNYQQRAEIYARKRGFAVGGMVPQPRPDEANDPVIADSIRANVALHFYDQNRRVTNFENFLYQSEMEMDPATVQARKELYRADKVRKLNLREALRIYERVLGANGKIGSWGELLLKHRRMREAGDRLQEETYEQQVRYLRLLREDRRAEFSQDTLALFDVLRAAGPAGNASPYHLAFEDVVLRQKAKNAAGQEDSLWPALDYAEPIWPPGPFDGEDPRGQPWVAEHVKERVRQNLGLSKPKPPPQPVSGGPPQPQPQPPPAGAKLP
jgi:hypothetical protein